MATAGAGEETASPAGGRTRSGTAGVCCCSDADDDDDDDGR